MLFRSTKKALERAARKVELAQGWEIEESGRYFVTPEGDIVEKKERKILDISQKGLRNRICII